MKHVPSLRILALHHQQGTAATSNSHSLIQLPALIATQPTPPSKTALAQRFVVLSITATIANSHSNSSNRYKIAILRALQFETDGKPLVECSQHAVHFVNLDNVLNNKRICFLSLANCIVCQYGSVEKKFIVFICPCKPRLYL